MLTLRHVRLVVTLALALIAGFIGAQHVESCDTLNDCCSCQDISRYGSSGFCWAPCGDWFFSLEGLVWKTCEDGLAYGTQTRTTPSIGTGSPALVDSRLKTPHFKWDWGFRLELGFNPPCDCWGIALYWTNFHTHTSSTHREDFRPSTSPAGAVFFTPGWGSTNFNTIEPIGIDITRARWKMNIDLVDVELGRFFCVSECLTIRPHIGFRIAWINQRYKIENFVADTPTRGTDTVVHVARIKSDYQGAGLRGGLDTEWYLGCGMSLYGTSAVSVLYGQYDQSYKFAKRNNALDPTFIGTLEQRHDFCACRAVTDAGIGLRWRTCLCADWMKLTLQLGWEHHLFINQNFFEDVAAVNGTPAFNPNFGENKNPVYKRGDLCLKGINFSARLDF